MDPLSFIVSAQLTAIDFFRYIEDRFDSTQVRALEIGSNDRQRRHILSRKKMVGKTQETDWFDLLKDGWDIGQCIWQSPLSNNTEHLWIITA
jgi:hypothetical protein